MRRLPLLLLVALLAGPAVAAGTGLPVEEDFARPPSPYEPPAPPPPVLPPPAPAFRPDFPPPRLLVAPAGPARRVMGTVCAVPETRRRPAIRCETPRAAVGAACRCDGRAGRVRTR